MNHRTLGRDRRGRLECSEVVPAAGASSSNEANGCDTLSGTFVSLPTFSMNMPFAGLLAYGVKTLETRNHTMFEGTSGSIALLHVGQRTYPDGGKHREILRRSGVAEEEVDRLTSLPAGFSRGSVVAIMELGDTRLADLEERCEDEIEDAVVA